jgi:hypothetical protein
MQLHGIQFTHYYEYVSGSQCGVLRGGKIIVFEDAGFFVPEITRKRFGDSSSKLHACICIFIM